MQIIDFHTHVYPHKIADRTKKIIRSTSGMKALTDATIDGLLSCMKKSGTTRSIILPVVTSPSQFDHINNYAVEMCKVDGITSFGGIHPDSEDPVGNIHKIVDLGLKGIKVHPDYQGVDVDDERYIRIFKEAAKEGLVVVTHAGLDPYNPHHVHCMPDMSRRVKEEVPDLKFVCAHVGGRNYLDLVEKYICGTDIYIDLSRLEECDLRLVRRVINAHRPDRILYASDSPWESMIENLEIYRSLNLGEELDEMILYKNALHLLGEDDGRE